MKRKLFVLLLMAAFSSIACQKERKCTDVGGIVFNADISKGPGTKTTVERITTPDVLYKVMWEKSDEITINGTVYTAAPVEGEMTKAVFSKKNPADPDPEADFYAFFPAGIQVDGKLGTIPAVQTYQEGKLSNVPMFAISDNNSLSFKNICGILAVSVKSSEMEEVSEIRVSSDEYLNGPFYVDENYNMVLETGKMTDENKILTLTCDPAVQTSEEGTVFYLPIPPRTYAGGITISVSDGDTTLAMRTKQDTPITVARDTVYPVTFTNMVKYGYAYFIGSTDGWSASEQSLEFNAEKFLYSGFVYAADPNGWGLACKFQRIRGSWDDQISGQCFDTFEGPITGDDNLIFTDGEGIYYLKLDLENRKIYALKVDTLSIIGDFAEWTEDVDMTFDSSNYCFSCSTSSLSGSFKFRVNHSWDVSIGGRFDCLTEFNGANLTLEQGVSNITFFPTRRNVKHMYCTAE